MFSRRTDWKLAPNRLSEVLREAQSRGQPILDLTISNPTSAGIPYDRAAILNSLQDELSLDYDPQPKGLLAAREAVADYYRERGNSLDPEHLLLTASTSEAYSYVFRLLANPGDEVLVPKPSYPLFEFLADLQDVRLVFYPLIYDHGWQIDLHSLEDAISERTRAIACVHPNNPTGSYVSDHERSALNQICETRQLALVIDEVFLDYVHGGRRRESFATNTDALTFTLSGLSKISALPQMKLGWITVSGPSDLSKEAMARLEVIADTFLSVSTPIQLAAPALLQERRNIQPKITERVQNNLCELDRQLEANRAVTRLDVKGGWNAVLRIPVTQPDEDLAIALLQKHGVLVHPGHFYDFPSDGYLVLSMITEPQLFREGVSRILSSANL
jgi:alanine-synthesizing transaminase